MESAEFSYARWDAVATQLVNCVALFLPASLMTMVGWFSFLFAQGNKRPDAQVLVYALLMLIFATWLAIVVWQRIRYRHVYRSRYVFDSQGVLVGSADGSTFLSWQEFESAEYFPLFFMLRLKGKAISRPVVIFEVDARRDVGRWEFLNNLARSKMSTRFERRWLS